MVYVSKCPHSYSGQRDEKGRYLRWQMSARVGKGLIGVRTPRGIKWYRSRSVHMPIEVSRKKTAVTLPSRCPLESGRASMGSAHLGALNSINLDPRACSSPKVDNIQ